MDFLPMDLILTYNNYKIGSMDLRLECDTNTAYKWADKLIRHRPSLLQLTSNGPGDLRWELRIHELMRSSFAFECIEQMRDQVNCLNEQLSSRDRKIDAVVGLHPFNFGLALARHIGTPFLRVTGNHREGNPNIQFDEQGPPLERGIRTVVIVRYTRSDGASEANISTKLLRGTPEVITAANLSIFDFQVPGSTERLFNAGVKTQGSLTNDQAALAVVRRLLFESSSDLHLSQ